MLSVKAPVKSKGEKTGDSPVFCYCPLGFGRADIGGKGWVGGFQRRYTFK